MAIAVDLDGIVTDFSRGFSEVVQELTDGRAPIVDDYSEVKTWAWLPWYWPGGFSKELNERAWGEIGDSVTFWGNLDALFPEQLDELIALHKGRKVVFMTRREGAMAYEQTQLWLIRHGIFEALLVRVRSGEEKRDICAQLGIRVIIDDNPKTMELCRDAGMAVVTITWPYNESVLGVYRADDLRGALSIAATLNEVKHVPS